MDTEKNKREEVWKAGSLFIPGGVLLGFGIGFLINNVAAGMLGGLGLGFILFALTVLFKK